MPSLREALGSALDGETLDTTTDDAPVVDTVVDTPAAEPAAPTPAPAGEGAPLRDGLGRFVPKDPAAAAAGAPPPAAAPGALPPGVAPGVAIGAPAPAPAASAAPAPVSWRAEAKAAWAALPPQVQAEVSRRELEITRTLSETAAARSIATQFSETITPYMPFIRAEGGDNPLEAVRSLMDLAVQLRTGSQFEKASAIAGLVKYYGVDIGPLDSALVGEAQEDPGVAMQRHIDAVVAQRLAPIENAARQSRERFNQTVSAQVDAELSAFVSKPHYEELAPMMADLIEVAGRSNVDLSLQDAYERALTLHPATRGSTLAQQTAQTAAQMHEIAQRAKRASVGGRVPAQSSSVANTATTPLDLRGAISQAMRDVPLA